MNRALAVLVAAGVALAGAGCSAVLPPRLTDAQQVIADLSFGPSDLRVVGGVDRSDRRYAAGQPIALSVEVDKDASVAVLRVLRNGTTSLVFPNKYQPEARLAAHTVLRIPEGAHPSLVAAPEPGLVLFEFVAATHGGAALFGKKPEGSAEFAEFGATTRAIAKKLHSSLEKGGGATATAHLAVEVEQR